MKSSTIPAAAFVVMFGVACSSGPVQPEFLVAGDVKPVDTLGSPVEPIEPLAVPADAAASVADLMTGAAVDLSGPRTSETTAAGSVAIDLHADELPHADLAPRTVPPPTGPDDPADVAHYVAEVWGNAGPHTLPWVETAADYLTVDLAEELRSAPVANAPVVRSHAIEVTDRSTANAHRFAVTLEQTRSTAGAPNPELTYVVVELVVIELDDGWRAGSLELIS